MAKDRLGSSVDRSIVQNVVSQYDNCLRYDPRVEITQKDGRIAAGKIWQRLAMDITHVGRNRYLSVIDTKSRYSIWIKLNSESGKEVASCLVWWNS